jgi:Mg-chelatase subunit ChlD
MIAVDLSGSMKMEDMEINGRLVDRLVMTKNVLTDFIKRRVGDRLGLILFADTAYLQAPLTFDRETVATLLDETVIGLVGEKTAIGDAIGLAVKRFDDREDSNRVLVLMTDGQNPEEAREQARNIVQKMVQIEPETKEVEEDEFELSQEFKRLANKLKALNTREQKIDPSERQSIAQKLNMGNIRNALYKLTQQAKKKVPKKAVRV